jgi:hypothetical protein
LGIIFEANAEGLTSASWVDSVAGIKATAVVGLPTKADDKVVFSSSVGRCGFNISSLGVNNLKGFTIVAKLKTTVLGKATPFGLTVSSYTKNDGYWLSLMNGMAAYNISLASEGVSVEDNNIPFTQGVDNCVIVTFEKGVATCYPSSTEGRVLNNTFPYFTRLAIYDEASSLNKTATIEYSFIRIYDTALTIDEISQILKDELPATVIDTPSLAWLTDSIDVQMEKATNKQAIKKGITNMSVSINSNNDIHIDEGTSHWLNVTVKESDGSVADLKDCTAIFTAGPIEKACGIENNVISVKLEPEETVGYLSNGYQIRIFDENTDVFQVIQGYIYIRKAHKPYTQNPLGGGR